MWALISGPASSRRFRIPGTWRSRSSMTSATVEPATSSRRGDPGKRAMSERGRWTIARGPPEGTRRPVRGRAALLGRGERDRPDRPGVAGMGGHREAEVGWQPGADLLPLAAAVGRAVDAAVGLLVEVLAAGGGHDQLVDALAELGVAVLGVELGPDALVARLPCRPTVPRLERADGRDPDPHAVAILGV